MTALAQGAVCSRPPAVPAAVERLGALVNKAELLEVLWAAWFVDEMPVDEHAALVSLVMLVNKRRRNREPMSRPLDASCLSGNGTAELRRACTEALVWWRTYDVRPV